MKWMIQNGVNGENGKMDNFIKTHMIQLKPIQSLCLVNNDLNWSRQIYINKLFSAEDIC